MYLKDIIQDNGIKFDENLRYAEDWLFNIAFFTKAKSIRFTEKKLYFYDRTVVSSLSKTWREDIFDSEVYISHKLREYVPQFYEEKDIFCDILWSQ